MTCGRCATRCPTWSRTGSSGGRSRSISRGGGRGGGGRRQHQGRAAQPSACIADSQIVKAHDTVGKNTSRYHGGKKITGRGRHLAVDAEGWLLALVVTAASVSDKAGAKLLLIRLYDAFSTLRIMWADSGYDGAPLAR